MEIDEAAADEPDDGTSSDDEDYEVIEAWAANGRGLAFDGRVVEYFPARGPSVRMHIRNLQARVSESAEGSAEIVLEHSGKVRRFKVEADQLPAFTDVIGTINATRESLQVEPGLDYW